MKSKGLKWTPIIYKPGTDEIKGIKDNFKQSPLNILGGNFPNQVDLKEFINFKTELETSISKLYKIDGLSGATITGRGVTNMISYWFGNSGYGKLLEELDYES